MFYLATSGVLVILSLILKRTDKRQNLLRSLAMSVIAYECYLCLAACVMTTVRVPVTVHSVSAANIVCIIGISVYLCKKRKFQSYYIDWKDAVFLTLLACVTLFLFVKRFSLNLSQITFATSDPATHLKMAMNLVNNKAAEGLCLGQVVNGLLIESIGGFFSGVSSVYKPFLIQCGINFFMAGATLWATLSKYQNCLACRLLIYAAVIAYALGYPYNDFLFGFVYLQMTVTIICYLFGLMQDFMEEGANIWIYGLFIGGACLGISVGYTLFAPPVYLGVLGLVSYKAYQEKWLSGKMRFLFSGRFFFCSLNIFLIPCFLTLWIIFVLPSINGSVEAYGAALSGAEGFIYRNLFSDFLLFAIPAIYGVSHIYKKNKVNLLSFFFPVFGIYYFVFLFLMIQDKISTYYFYKLNFLLWMTVILAFAIGMCILWTKEKSMFLAIACLALLITGIHFSGFEKKQNQLNINRVPVADSNAFFRIYDNNEIYKNSSASLSGGLMDISQKVLTDIGTEDKADPVIFIGAWQDLYWYEALANQRCPGVIFLSFSDALVKFQRGELGTRAVVAKEPMPLEDPSTIETTLAAIDEALGDYSSYISKHCIYENEYAWIIERDEGEAR